MRNASAVQRARLEPFEGPFPNVSKGGNQPRDPRGRTMGDGVRSVPRVAWRDE
jgi:hypothetical protein